MLVELPMVMECARSPLPVVPPLLLLLRMLRGVEGSPAGNHQQDSSSYGGVPSAGWVWQCGTL